VSTYQVDKLCWRVQHDPPFRERLSQDPAAALADLPLTAEERAALLAGDVARLYQLGAHPYLLGHLTRYDLFGLTRESYGRQMKALLATPAEQARARLAGRPVGEGERPAAARPA
jgi:hypothetical protein